MKNLNLRLVSVKTAVILTMTSAFFFISTEALALQNIPNKEIVQLKGDITVAFCSVNVAAAGCRQDKPNYKNLNIELKLSEDGQNGGGSAEINMIVDKLKYIVEFAITKRTVANVTNYRLYMNLYTYEIASGIFTYRGDMIVHVPTLDKLNDFSFSPNSIDGQGGFYIPRIFVSVQ